MTDNPQEQRVPANNTLIDSLAGMSPFLKTVAAILPFVPFIAAIQVGLSTRNNPSNEAFLGALSLASFSWIVIAFSLTSISLLALTLRRTPQLILHLINRPFKHDVLALASSNNDGRNERAEALTIMAVFIFFMTVFTWATGNPAALFTTTVGSAAIALITLHFLAKLGLSAVKKYRFQRLD